MTTRRDPNIPTRDQAGERPPTGPALSPAQAASIRAWVQQAGRERLATIRGEFSEADFLAGAMVAFFALGSEGQMPPLWLLGGPMTGRSLFTTDGEPPRAVPEWECGWCGEPLASSRGATPGGFCSADCQEESEAGR